jgi:Sec-independent protein secretion pathway component TatC
LLSSLLHALGVYFHLPIHILVLLAVRLVVYDTSKHMKCSY